MRIELSGLASMQGREGELCRRLSQWLIEEASIEARPDIVFLSEEPAETDCAIGSVSNDFPVDEDEITAFVAGWVNDECEQNHIEKPARFIWISP